MGNKNRRAYREGAPEMIKSKRVVFIEGIMAGIPIGLGYFAVSFSLGIAAKNAGMTAFQGFLMSLLGHASAGEYAAITIIASAGAYLEMALMTLIANARYMLMSFAMSQRMKPDINPIHRFLMGYFITDELFAATISRPGYLSPVFMYGAICVASPCWAVGTGVGVLAGQLLPASVVSALSVALYGMFLAVIIPAAKKDKIVAGLILFSFAASWAAGVLPGISSLSEGTRIYILTIVISAAAALCFPIKMDEEGKTP
ncbi:MAG: AzlC family ABC transporter permease [Oscillospiraceae bacterium]|nr:AzlC family ABC transporter permease [Oscillospiraceae bacterium]